MEYYHRRDTLSITVPVDTKHCEDLNVYTHTMRTLNWSSVSMLYHAIHATLKYGVHRIQKQVQCLQHGVFVAATDHTEETGKGFGFK